MADRIAEVQRNTLETQIKVRLNLDGTGIGRFDTGVPFLEHMLDQIARHGMIDKATEELRKQIHIEIANLATGKFHVIDESGPT